MKAAVIALAFAIVLHALPVPPEVEWQEEGIAARDVSAEDEAIKLPAVKHIKRQYSVPYYNWNLLDYWGTPPPEPAEWGSLYWRGTPENPYGNCFNEEGKAVGLECSGGTYEETHTSFNGYFTDTDKGFFMSFHSGPPNPNGGWNPFAPASTNRVGTAIGGVSRTGAVAGGGISSGGISGGGTVRPSGGGISGGGTTGRTTNTGRTSTTSRTGTGTSADKNVKGCVDLGGRRIIKKKSHFSALLTLSHRALSQQESDVKGTSARKCAFVGERQTQDPLRRAWPCPKLRSGIELNTAGSQSSGQGRGRLHKGRWAFARTEIEQSFEYG